MFHLDQHWKLCTRCYRYEYLLRLLFIMMETPLNRISKCWNFSRALKPVKTDFNEFNHRVDNGNKLMWHRVIWIQAGWFIYLHIFHSQESWVVIRNLCESSQQRFRLLWKLIKNYSIFFISLLSSKLRK